MSRSTLIVLALFLVCGSFVSAHNHLIWPVPRDPGAFYEGDGNCENGNRWAPDVNNFKRGQDIQGKWSFNNHRGGFARFSIVPVNDDGIPGVFNRPENIIHFTCHTRTCGGAGIGFDSGDKFPCTSNFKIPTHLPDGNYVLQWAVYSMFDSDANPNKGLPNYLSCANIKIQGGPQTNERPGRCSFSWVGGDKEYTRTNKGNYAQDTCVYFIRTNFGRSQETVQINPNLIKINGRPTEVEECLRNGGVGKIGGGSAPAQNNNDDTKIDGECQNFYRSVAGDNCDNIAQRHGISVNRFKALNSFINCADIWVNTPCCVDKPKKQDDGGNWDGVCKTGKYISVAGDNCDNIAQRHGISVARFKKMNDFINCADIWANTPCCIDKN